MLCQETLRLNRQTSMKNSTQRIEQIEDTVERAEHMALVEIIDKFAPSCHIPDGLNELILNVI